MTEEEMESRLEYLENKVTELAAQRFAYRDLVARILGYLSAAQENPTQMLQHFLEATDQRLEDFPVERQESLEAAEIMRGEVDWIVASARTIAGSASRSTDH